MTEEKMLKYGSLASYNDSRDQLVKLVGVVRSSIEHELFTDIQATELVIDGYLETNFGASGVDVATARLSDGEKGLLAALAQAVVMLATGRVQ